MAVPFVSSALATADAVVDRDVAIQMPPKTPARPN